MIYIVSLVGISALQRYMVPLYITHSLIVARSAVVVCLKLKGCRQTYQVDHSSHIKSTNIGA